MKTLAAFIFIFTFFHEGDFVYGGPVSLYTEASLDAKFGDPYDDCLNVERCVNCRGTGGRNQFRTMDGTCNNLGVPLRGAALTKHKRYLDAEYLANTKSYPRGFAPFSSLPSAHTVAHTAFEAISGNDGNDHQPHKTSILFMVFGQFIDHDVTATSHGKTGPCNAACTPSTNSELYYNYPCMPIEKVSTTTDTNKCTKLTRTRAACRASTNEKREQVNNLTSFVDGSAIYGSSDAEAQFLRVISGTEITGELRTVGTDPKKALMPEDPSNDEPCNNPEMDGCFASGDKRSAEHIGLAAMHTLWVREHNRVATTLKSLNPRWSGSRIFLTAREIVSAEIQSILLNEWLDLVTDINTSGYDETVDPSISNVFSHAVFRFGHTLVPDKFPLHNNNFDPFTQKPIIALREAFFNIKPIKDYGIEPIMFGMMGNESEAFDGKFAEAIARHLFIPLGQGGLEDLSAINIHRGRDHGLPPYNKWREFCGFSKLTGWSDLNGEMSSQTITNLQAVYSSVDDIDVFVGGVGEMPVLEKVVGKTFGCIIKKQFEDIFKGDRHFYKNFVFTNQQYDSINSATMHQIVCDNLDGIVSLHNNPFVAYKGSGHTRHTCITDTNSPDYKGVRLNYWKDVMYT